MEEFKQFWIYIAIAELFMPFFLDSNIHCIRFTAHPNFGNCVLCCTVMTDLKRSKLSIQVGRGVFSDTHQWAWICQPRQVSMCVQAHLLNIGRCGLFSGYFLFSHFQVRRLLNRTIGQIWAEQIPANRLANLVSLKTLFRAVGNGTRKESSNHGW